MAQATKIQATWVVAGSVDFIGIILAKLSIVLTHMDHAFWDKCVKMLHF